MAGPRIGQVAGPRSASRLSGAATRRGVAWSLTAARVGHLTEGVGVPADNLSSERPRESTAVAQLPRKFSIPLLRRTKCVIASGLSGKITIASPVLTHFVRGGQTELKWQYKLPGRPDTEMPASAGLAGIEPQQIRTDASRGSASRPDRSRLSRRGSAIRFPAGN